MTTAILEQLFNASDIAVVGNFTGGYSTAAVAAVGANGSLIALVVNLFVGVALGANVVIANAMGRGDREAVSRAVHSSIVVALVGGVIVALLGELIAEPVLTTLGVCGVRICWVELVFPHSRTFRNLMTVYPVSLGVTAALIFAALLYYRPSRRRPSGGTLG